jgi:phage gpG-like protein
MPIKPGTIFEEIEAIQRAVRQIPLLIGNEAENFFKDNFNLGGFQGDKGLEPWKPRKENFGRKRAILVNKGNLKKGIRKFVIGNIIQVKVTGVATAYADIHNQGGVTHPTVTPKMKAWAWAMFKKTKLAKYKAIALSKGSLTINIPQRKFIGNSRQLDKLINKLIIDHLKKTIKKY